MSSIQIENIGPIKDIYIELNKINVFIGQQSSGKSTLVKIICFCKWIEKRIQLNPEDKLFQDEERLLKEQLYEFHRLNKRVYFNEKSFFKYESKHVVLEFKNGKLSRQFNQDSKYLNNKIIYIPAERNLVGVLPNIGRYSDTRDNLLNFVYDWFEIRKKYNKENTLELLNLGVKYSYDDVLDDDVLSLNKGKKSFGFSAASSGIQSVLPLVLLVDYLTKEVFNEPKVMSPDEWGYIAKIVNALSSKDVDIKDLAGLIGTREYNFSQFFIEEPEQNLFPSTQKVLLEHLIKVCYADARKHELFITTHSPYILYVVNNSILASKVTKNKSDLSDIPAINIPIDTEEVGLWSLEDGTIKNLKDEDGFLRDNFFDASMQEIIKEHQTMLQYLDFD